MAKVIIGIHGLANKPPKAKLTQWWKKSIVEGLKKNKHMADPRFTFRMVYWAKLLYKNQQHDDPAFSFDSLYNDQPYIEAQPRALKRYTDKWWDSSRAALRGTGYRNVRPASPALKLLAGARPNILSKRLVPGYAA